MIAAIILFSIAGTLAICGIVFTCVSDIAEWMFTLLISAVLTAFGLVAFFTTPRPLNVREGKAHYIEQNHIEVINGDTVNNYKTYQIEWNQNTK